MEIQVPEAVILKARASGLLYYWWVEFTNGTTLAQFSEDGTEPQGVLLADKERLLLKSLDDPYPFSMVIKGVRRAAWIPVYDGASVYSIELKSNEQLVIYKKNYVAQDYKYVVYCIGSRTEPTPSHPVERVCYICPPLKEYLETGDGKVTCSTKFAGAVVESIDSAFKNPYDIYLEQCNKTVEHHG